MDVESRLSIDSSLGMLPHEPEAVQTSGWKDRTRNYVLSNWKSGSTFKSLKGLRLHLVKIVAGSLILLCIAQTIYIFRFQAGLVRIANDPVDNLLHGVNWDSAAIWEDPVQSAIHNAHIVPVHSHNDYFQRVPLFEALASGCISVEADIHLKGSDLLVGHSKWGLNKAKTLRSMYLDPLQRMLEAQDLAASNGSWRGIFNEAPNQTLVLLIDIKTSSQDTFDKLYEGLQPLRELDLLTYWNGTHRIMRALTVVGTGNTLLDSVLALNNSHRDIFLDAPLNSLWSIKDDYSSPIPRYTYDQSNSYLASTKWSNAILFPTPKYADYPDSASLRDMRASQLEQARARGLISRYWDLPKRPQNLREIVWRVLIQKRVGLLNMENLGTVRARAHGWGEIPT